MYPAKILVLDDSEEDVEHLQQSFVENKVRNELSVIRDAAEALLYLWRATRTKEIVIPDLVFVSHHLKIKNRRIVDRANHPKLRDTPFVILFKHEQEYDRFNHDNPLNQLTLMSSFKIESLVAVLNRVSNLGLAISRESSSAPV